MLALLIKVVREMVFTLGKWSFSKKPGKFTSYYSQGSNQRLGQQVQRLNSQHTCHWGGSKRSVYWICCKAHSRTWSRTYNSPVCADPEKTGSRLAEKSSTGQKQWKHSGTYWKRRMWHVTTITNLEQCEWLFWTFSSVALSNMKSMIYELDNFI